MKFIGLFPVNHIRPGIEIPDRFPCEVMIEIAAADDVIALTVFPLHIAKKHLKLGVPLGCIGPVGGKMGVNENQVLAVLRRML